MSNSLGNLPAQLFSPFKMFYIAYVRLMYFKVEEINWLQFAFISLILDRKSVV